MRTWVVFASDGRSAPVEAETPENAVRSYFLRSRASAPPPLHSTRVFVVAKEELHEVVVVAGEPPLSIEEVR